jgi:predicted transcriptional regulator
MSQISLIQTTANNHNKDRLDIIACVLKVIARNVNIKNLTEIHRFIGNGRKRGGGITSGQAKRYLFEMQEEYNLISITFESNTKISLTATGWKFLELYDQMRQLLLYT